MTRIKVVFWTICIGLTALWLVADPIHSSVTPFAQTRVSLMFYFGIMAIGTMSVAMLLALRSATLEPYVGGLDKSYRLHKWVGVAALVAAIGHWVSITGQGTFVSLGWMPRQGRRQAPPPPHGILGTLAHLSGPARSVGQVCFWATVVLIVLALLRWFPYRWFLQTHRLIAIVYLVLVFHSVVLMKAAYWTHAIAWISTLLMAGGTVAAVITLFRRVGRTRQAVGEIDTVATHADVHILQVGVCLKDRWSGHAAGQFAFVDFEDGEGPHPFTISSTWKDDGHLTFLIKELGDYTRSLPSTLRKGSLVTVEGPYGRFNFQGKHERQIWISAGIGITPFISRMQDLATHPDGKIIDLFHATGTREIRPVDRLRNLAKAARVRLHIWVKAEDGSLTAERIRGAVPDWKSTDIWFCGPVQLGEELRHDFLNAGMSPSAFHQELFHLR
jgi:predicted ferric reductase